MADTMDFDVVVLGAGPAGSSAARQARALGLTVAIVDRAVFPRPKLCGALLSGRGRKALKSVFGIETDRENFLYSRQVAFKWDGEELCRFEAPYDLTYTYRLDLDHRMLLAAVEAGAADMQGCRIETYDDARNRLVMADGRVLNYGVLIGADGAASPTAKHLFGRAFNPDTIGFAFELEAPGDCAEEAVMSIDFAIVRWGYGWNFPKHKSSTIGLGALQSVEQDLKDRMTTYLAREGADPEQKFKGAFIPLGDYKKVPGRGNVLLAGDAAGFVDSMTGEGIAYAMESGAAAAEAAAEALAAGKPETALKAYQGRVKYIMGELDKSNRLRQIAFSGPLRDIFKQKLATSQNMRMTFFELLEGATDYAEVEKLVAKNAAYKVAKKMTGWPRSVLGKIKS